MKKRGMHAYIASVILVGLFLTFIPYSSELPTANRRAEHDEGIVIPESPEKNLRAAGIDHDPITINGNLEFDDTASLEGWDGNGGEAQPYIIEGYDIDRNGEDGNCILIENTSVHFVIRDCFLVRANRSDRAGIWLTNASNCRIENNTFYQNRHGIHAVTENCIITNNTIMGIVSGIVTDFSITLSLSNNTIISENRINGTTHGLWLTTCEYSTIENNDLIDISQRGVRVEFCLNVSIIGNMCANNNVGGIFVSNSDNNVIVNNYCSNGLAGIYVSFLTDCIISDCTLIGNSVGLLVTNAGGMLCTNNLFLDSENQGIQISGTSSYNDYLWSTFKNNPIHVECLSPDNNIEYGYYDDYSGFDQNNDGFGDVPYYCDGTNPDADHHPLVFEPTVPVWNPTPIDQIVEYGSDFEYALDIISPPPVDEWYINDTSHFIIDNEGVINNKILLEVGIYPLDVTATNVYGTLVEGTFKVTVQDTVAPVWNSQVENRSYAYGESVEFQMIAWDLAGIDRWTSSDTENFTLTDISSANTGIAIIKNALMLPRGEYPFTLTVYDNHDNMLNAQFYVIVGEEPVDDISPVWIVSPYDISIEEGLPFILQVGAYDESGIDSWELTGSSAFAIDDNGIITNSSTLAVGVYNLEIRVFDPVGNFDSATFIVTVIASDGNGTTGDGAIEVGFIISTAGLAIAVVALFLGLGAFLNSRKSS